MVLGAVSHFTKNERELLGLIAEEIAVVGGEKSVLGIEIVEITRDSLAVSINPGRKFTEHSGSTNAI